MFNVTFACKSAKHFKKNEHQITHVNGEECFSLIYLGLYTLSDCTFPPG